MYMRGFGQITDASKCTTLMGWLANSDCWGHSIPYWQTVMTPGAMTPVPPAPTGAALTEAPASAEDAAALAQSLANQQMIAAQQQAASQVQPVSDIYGVINSLTGGIFAGSGSTTGVPWWAWAVAGGILLLAAFGGRR